MSMKLILAALMAAIAMPFFPGEAVQPGEPFLIVNKANNELALVADNEVQKIVPAGTGKSDGLTPEGLFTVKVKAVNPYYRKKDILGGDPANPLGTRWIGFDALGTDGRTYGVHGTNVPESVGTYASNGCIRLKNEDVERLFEEVPAGTKVLITNTMAGYEELAARYGAIR